MMPCLFVWKRLLSLSLIVLDFVVANNDLAFNGDLGIAADPGWGTTTTKTDNQNDQWRGAHLSDNPAAIDQSGSWSTAGTDTYRDDGCRDANNGNNNLQTPKSKKRLRRRGCPPVSAPDRHRGSDTVPNGESIPSTPGDPQKLPEFDLPAKPAAKPDKKLCPDLLANYPVCDTGISIIPNPLAPGYVLLPRCHLCTSFTPPPFSFRAEPK